MHEKIEVVRWQRNSLNCLVLKAGVLTALVIGLLVPAMPAAPPPHKTTTKQAAACGDYGTAIEFEPTPKDAAKRAAGEEKLVMVLHVSGHFEDPGLT